MGRQPGKKNIPCTQCKIYKKMEEEKAWLTEKDIWESYAKNRVSMLIDKSILGFSLTEQLVRLALTLRLRLRRRRSRKYIRNVVHE